MLTQIVNMSTEVKIEKLSRWPLSRLFNVQKVF